MLVEEVIKKRSSAEVIFNLLRKVSHTQVAITRLIDKELAKFSVCEREEVMKLIKTNYPDNYSPLMWAARNGIDKVIRYLLLGSDVGSINVDEIGGWNMSTALMKATESNHVNAVTALIDLNAKMDVQNQFGSTALMLAADRGHVEIVRLLSGNRANLDIQNNDEYTALILAVSKNYPIITKILCDAGAVKSIQYKGKTALMMAAEFQHEECMISLFDSHPPYRKTDPIIDHQSFRGLTALMLAAVNGSEKIVKQLLKRGANTTIKCKALGNSALTYACVSGNANLVELLLSHPQPWDPKNNNHYSPFMVAVHAGKADIVNLLVAKQNMDPEWIQESCLETSKDGCTALHLAAIKGHIHIYVKLMDLCPRAVDLLNQEGKKATQLLVHFYRDHENEFEQFVEEAKTKCEMLELLPEILPLISPTKILNDYFSKILLMIKDAGEANGVDEINMVTNLVHLAVGLKLAKEAKPLEALDIDERLQHVQGMLRECMASSAMDQEREVLIAIQHRSQRNEENHSEGLHQARAFIAGPLNMCLEHRFLSILGTRQMSIFVDGVFNKSLKVRSPRLIEEVKDVFQMRSNFVHWRTNPSVNFYLEGVCKFLTLCLVAVLCWQQSPFTMTQMQPNYDDDTFKRLAVLLEVVVFASVLCEFGKCWSFDFKMQAYFAEIWIFFDVVNLLILLVWCGLTIWQNNEVTYAYVPRGAEGHAAFPLVMDDATIPHPTAKALLCFVAVPMSIGLLRYVSTIRGVGHYVLMVMAMVWDLRNLLVVFFISTAGFVIAFHGLFPYLDDFRTVQRTSLELFFAVVGQFDPAFFFEGDPFESVGIILYVAYITFTAIILINIIIATFAAIHNQISKKASETWCFIKACNVKRFLLVEEKNAFCMLPAPLNLVPALFFPIHYVFIRIRRNPLVNISSISPNLEATIHPQMSLGNTFSPQMLMIQPSVKNLRVNAVVLDGEREDKNHFCSCSCAAYDGEDISAVVGDPFLSVSGTASDMVLGFLFLLPCVIYEIHLCLKEIRDRALKDKHLYWKCLAITVVFFPFVYFGFFVTMLFEIVNVRTHLVVCDGMRGKRARERCIDTLDVYFKPDLVKLDTTEDIKIDPVKKYYRFSIKVVRAELTRPKGFLGSRLNREANLSLVLKIGDQVLATKPFKSVDMNAFWEATKDFYLYVADDRDTHIAVTVYDNNTEIGRYDDSIREWIANERFGGSLPLTVGDCKVGKVYITAIRKPIESQPDYDSVRITTLSVHILRCVLTAKKTSLHNMSYKLRVSIDHNPTYSSESTHVSFVGSCCDVDQLLCVSMSTIESEPDSQRVVVLELLGSREKETNEYYVTLAKCKTTIGWLTNKEFGGQIELFSGRNSTCACVVELTASVSSESTIIEGSSKPANAADVEDVNKSMQDPNTAVCSCGKKVRHSCRAMKNRKGRLFSVDDLERIFLGVEANHIHVTKSEFSYELRKEIRRESMCNEKRHISLKNDYEEVNKRLVRIEELLENGK